MLETTSWPFGEPTWTPASHSVKTAGNEVMQHFHAESKVPNVSNATVHTNLNIIENLGGVAKQTPRLTYQGWKPRKENHAPTHSNTWIVAETTKQTPISVCFGGTDSIGNGIRGSTLRSMKTDQNQFVLKWIALLINDYQKPQNLFTKRSQELSHCQYPTWNISSFRHHLNPGTTMVWNPQDS